jgi:hypothetical protein
MHDSISSVELDSGPVASLYDPVFSMPAPAVQDLLPAWAVPPSYGYPAAHALTGYTLSGMPDTETAAVVLGGWAFGYGRAITRPGAPERVAAFAGLWQLAGHFAAATVAADPADEAIAEDDALAGLVAVVIKELWPDWGTVAGPRAQPMQAGLALDRHLRTWHRSRPDRTGLNELVQCAVKTGSERAAAQHRLIHLIQQQPERRAALLDVLPAAGS